MRYSEGCPFFQLINGISSICKDNIERDETNKKDDEIIRQWKNISLLKGCQKNYSFQN